MTNEKIPVIIFSTITIIVFIVIISMGLFSIWIFIGMLLIGLMYIFGYYYVLNHFKLMEEIDRNESLNKKKLNWCWEKANEILKLQAGGQGLEWNKGVGRKSEYKTFHDGIQLRGFRSMEGYLANSQQLVVIIFDIESEDIARYDSDPSPDVLSNHFVNFEPFQSKESFIGRGISYPSKYGSRYSARSNKGLVIRRPSINGYENFDSFGTKVQPSEQLITDSLKKLKKG